MTRQSLDALTGIRFFAALHVVLLHFYRPFFETGPLHLFSRFIDVGFISVGLFFTLSGFILVYNYIHREFSPIAFWRARLARIYPVFLLAFVISLPLLALKVWTHSQELIFMCTGPCTPGRLISGVILTPLLLQNWDPHTIHMVNGPGWSLSAEAFFYFLFPFLLRPLARLRSQVCLLAIGGCWLGSLIVPAFVMWRYGQTPQSIEDPVARFVQTCPLLHLAYFVAGMLAGCIYYRLRQGVTLVRFGRFGDALVLLAILALCSALYVPKPPIPELFLSHGILIPVWCCLIGGLAIGGHIATLLSHPWLLLLGNASYATYILQAPIHSYFRGVGMLTHKDLFGTEFHNIVPALVFLVMLLILSVVTHESIEVPGRKLILSLGQRRPAMVQS